MAIRNPRKDGRPGPLPERAPVALDCPGEAPIEAPADALGQGRYQLQSRLGEGGMAGVWLAWDERLGVHRAVKVLEPHFQRSPTIRLRFEAEARAMARLQHPHIVTVHDVGVDGDRSYIVMELVAGGSLADVVRKQGPLPPRRACELLLPVLEALETAHAAGIVHRDVKPHNVLVTQDGVPKITDFGIAHIDNDSHLTRTGAVMGTIPYMAPEQKTDSKSVGPGADVYGVAATLYHLVTGSEPYDLYVQEVREALLERFPAPLAEVIDRATRYAPADRYPSALAMRTALLAAMARLPEASDPILDTHAAIASAHAAPRSVPSTKGEHRTSPTLHALDGTPTPVLDREEDDLDPDAMWVMEPTTDDVRALEARFARRSPWFVRAMLAAGLGLGTAAFGGSALLITATVVASWGTLPELGTARGIEPAPAVDRAPAPIELLDVVIPPVEPLPKPVGAARPQPAPAAPAVAPTPQDAPVPVAAAPEHPPLAEPAPPAKPTVVLFVNSTPRKLPVEVDGRVVGSTPYTGTHAVGAVQVSIRPPMGAAWTRSVVLREGAGREAICWDFDANAVCTR